MFSNKVRNLGFILDSNLTMEQHVIKTCQTAYYELKRISSIRRYLTEDAAKQLVTSCVLSRLDYCNSLLVGTPNSVIQPMQKVQNTAARLILRAPRHQNCTPILQQLHWLPISERIKYKTACMCYKAIIFLICNTLQSFPLSPLFVRHTHAQNPSLQPQNPWLSHFLTLWPPHLENLPQDISHSATLSSFNSALWTRTSSSAQTKQCGLSDVLRGFLRSVGLKSWPVNCASECWVCFLTHSRVCLQSTNTSEEVWAKHLQWELFPSDEH